MTHPNSFKGVIFDIDGVLQYQGNVCPGALETLEVLRSMGVIIRFLTNSTLKSRSSCAHKLRTSGFQAIEEEVVTASSATAAYLRQENPKSIWVMLDGAGIDEFSEFTHSRDNPEIIVVGDYRNQFNFENLNHALRLLKRGAKLIGMQAELVDSSAGEIELNVGSWVQLLETASQIQPIYIGKPYPFAIELAINSIPLRREDVIMVGDRITTDIAGARKSGLKSVLLKTGEFQEQDLQTSIQPDFIFESIQQVLALF
jgi:HAD superfamily hydrolase (TIGR01458 family)